MARIYRTKVTALAKALQEPDSRSEATEALRGLVDAILLTPNASGEALQIELRGNLAAMLSATVQSKRSPESDDLSLQVSMVAGAGFEPATFGLAVQWSVDRLSGQSSPRLGVCFRPVSTATEARIRKAPAVI